jgi:thiol-disulfide isomerase/thioredoxin
MMLAACTSVAKTPQYKFDFPVAGVEDGSLVYLVEYDKGEKIDSAVVKKGVAKFKGNIEEPVMVTLTAQGKRLARFVVEQGKMKVSGTTVSGTPTNDAINRFEADETALQEKYRQLPEDATQDQIKAIQEEYEHLCDSTLEANIDNPFGYYMFVNSAYEMTPEQLEAALAKHPKMNDGARVKKVKAFFARKAATAPGKKFTDFEVAYNDSIYRLSDYVGKGKPALVDFWASWCGPCRRESVVIKDLYNQYASKGLEVVGIAVWDEPENTLAAIDQLQLPWKQVINAQTIPTDIYGILGIPCIILFDANGTIVDRDKQGDELREAVAAMMKAYAETPAPAAAEE